MRIVAIAGSLREGSLNRQLAGLAGESLARLDPSIDFEVLDWSDVPPLSEDIEHPAPEAVTRVRAEVAAADGVWFFTPEYNHFFPGVEKNLVDWLSRPQEGGAPQVLAGKPIAISGITPGMDGTAIAQDHLVTLLSFLDCHVMNKPRLTIPSGFSLVKDGILDLGDGAKRLDAQARAFVAFIGR
ncbi:MAG: NAD(P)H-dependent oxidoreductase [Atopobiaceae bacterium]|jgi:chromate reductase|nr:NAD(P)H-dependent oxidoreductase [Atopobiaceae bacterium]MCI2206916.1 NAD(P)H-dependent oxidoreductase [Atopobiaceae bacterium]